MNTTFSEFLQSDNTLVPPPPMTEDLAWYKILESHKSSPQGSVETSLDLLLFNVGEEQRGLVMV